MWKIKRDLTIPKTFQSCGYDHCYGFDRYWQEYILASNNEPREKDHIVQYDVLAYTWSEGANPRYSYAFRDDDEETIRYKLRHYVVHGDYIYCNVFLDLEAMPVPSEWQDAHPWSNTARWHNRLETFDPVELPKYVGFLTEFGERALRGEFA